MNSICKQTVETMSANETFEQVSLAQKRMKDLFVAQFDRPSDLEDINLSRLTPFQRALLVTDGTVTQFIEAYTLSPVNIVRLHQERQTTCTDNPWLEVPRGTGVIARHVILQTERRAGRPPTIHVYATSLIVLNRTPPVIREGLALESEGLGKLLQHSGLETRRDLLWCGLERPKDLPAVLGHLEGKPFLTRTYRIVADGQPIMLINEKFPLGESVVKK